MGKTSLDGHWRGLAVVSQALRDAGMEVIYVGIINPDEAVAIAIQEGVDVVGFNIGGGYKIVETVLKKFAEMEMKPLIVAGGTIPPQDVAILEEMGVNKVFVPGSCLDDIVNYIREKVRSGEA